VTENCVGRYCIPVRSGTRWYNNQTSTPISLFVAGAAPCSMTPWATSASDSLASKAALPVANSRFSGTLAAQSVTTFVGKP
jgi:glucuronoarabinoxylan endo-1,4-beta-xylanase